MKSNRNTKHLILKDKIITGLLLSGILITGKMLFDRLYPPFLRLYEYMPALAISIIVMWFGSMFLAFKIFPNEDYKNRRGG